MEATEIGNAAAAREGYMRHEKVFGNRVTLKADGVGPLAQVWRIRLARRA
jgi:hypothetical protein